MKDISYLRSENETLRQKITELENRLAGTSGAPQMADAVAEAGRLRDLFDTMAQGVVYQDATGVIFMANPAAALILGLAPDELLGSVSIDPQGRAIGEDGGALSADEQPAMLALRSGMPVNDVVMGIAHAHEAAFSWILVSATPQFRANESQPYQVISTFTDITERKRVEQNLRENENRHRALLESLNISLCRWLPDTTLVYANDIYRRIFGLHGDVAGRKWLDFLPADVRAETAAFYRQLADDPHLVTYEHPVIEADGSVRHYQWVDTPVFSGAGRLVEFQSVGIDVTERKQAEAAQQASETRAVATLKAIPDMMFRLDRDGTFLDYKADRDSLYHQPDTTLVGMRSREVLPPEVCTLIEHHSAVTLATGELQTFEYELDFPGAGARVFEARMSPSGSNEVVIIVRDITVRKQTDQRLRESEERFRSFFETSAAVMLIIEPASGAIVDANMAATEFYGYTRPQLMHMNINDINQLPPEEVKRERLRALHEQRNYFIFPHRLANGEVRTVEVRSHPIQTDGRALLFSIIYDATEREMAVVRLEDERRKIAQIAATVPGVICSFRQTADGASSMPYASPVIRDVFGLEAVDVADDMTPIFDRIHPDDLGHVATTIAQSAQGMTTWHDEYRYNHPNKGWVWIEGRSVPTLQADDSLLWHGYVTDITERKQTEQLVYAQRDLARSIGKVTSLRAGLQLCFEAALQVSGLDCGGIYLFNTDRTMLELAYHQGISAAFVREVASYPDDSTNVQAILPGQSLYAMADEFDAEHVYRREGLKNISVVPILYQDTVIGCLNLAAHTPVRMSGFIRHALETIATEIGNYIVYLRAEMSVRQSEERYRTLANELEQRVIERTAEVQDLYDNAPTGYHSLDAEGRLLLINKTEAAWLGYSREELIGRPLSDLLAPHSIEAHRTNFRTFVQRGWVRDLELEMLRKDGSTFPVLINSTVIRDGDGNYLMSRSTVFDNTQRKLAEIALRARELELRKSRDQLSAANIALADAARMKDEFMANMSHELRTPLTGILGLSEALQMQIYGSVTEPQLRALRNIEASGRHLLTLINDILDLSKIESGMLELNIEPLDLAEVCQAALQLIRGMANKKGHRVSFSMSPPMLTVRGDVRRLKQMLVNLLSNAIKFTPAGGELGLEVQADPADETVRLTVWDKGVGIAAADLERLFQPFVQLESGLARQHEGSGLGLPLVRSMARLHGGDVHVESQPGEGSRFTVLLPWVDDDEVAPAAPLMARAGVTGSARSSLQTAPGRDLPKVLLVDDNELTIDAVGSYLEHQGYVVTVAHSGLELLDVAPHLHPDIILVDVQMPAMDGLEATRRIRAHADPTLADVPIIALTALAMTGDRERCLAAGATDYMSKPVRLVQLGELIRQHLP